MKNVVKFIFFVIVPLCFCAACDTHVLFEKNIKINGEKWHMDSVVVFQTEIQDTTELYNIYLNIRHSTSYEYRNFYLFFETVMPDGIMVRDTLECFLADKSGKWQGKGFGRVKSNRFHFRENVWFPRKGKYEFRLEQAMREEVLKGIIDIGVRIEKK